MYIFSDQFSIYISGTQLQSKNYYGIILSQGSLDPKNASVQRNEIWNKSKHDSWQGINTYFLPSPFPPCKAFTRIYILSVIVTISTYSMWLRIWVCAMFDTNQGSWFPHSFFLRTWSNKFYFLFIYKIFISLSILDDIFLLCFHHGHLYLNFS